MINRGKWYRYTPEDIRPGYPENTIFWRRDDDEADDFYEWSFDMYEISAGVDASGSTKVSVVDGLVSCVSKDISMLSLPEEFTLIEMEEGEAPPGLGWVLEDGVFRAPVVNKPFPFVYQVDFWSRMTDEEAQAVKHEMDSQPFRLRRIFESAGSYREDHELWPMLSGLAEALFGEDRAKEILAPSE